MILKSLQLRNFKQYENLNFDFKEGLVGIVGKNGAGKSSIFEAILVCLYGSGADQGKAFYKSSWAKDKEHVFLELIFEVNAKTYIVRREFKGKAQANYSNLYDQKEVLIATGSKEVTKEISQLLGLDKNAFTRSIFSGQKELSEISNSKKEERLKLVRKMVGLEKLDEIQNLIRRDRTAIKNKIEGQQSNLLDGQVIIDIKAKKEVLVKDLASAKTKIESFQTDFTNKNKAYLKSKESFAEQHQLFNQFSELNGKTIKYNTALESFKQQIEQANNRKTHIEKLKAELSEKAPKIELYLDKKSKIKVLEKQKEQFEEKKLIEEKGRSFRKQQEDKKHKTQQLKIETEKGEEWSKQLEMTIKTIEKEEAEMAKKKKEMNLIMAKASKINGKIDDRQNKIQQIEALGVDANCPTCHQPLIKAYEEVMVALKQEIQDYEVKELKGYDLSIKKFENEITNQSTNIKQLNKHENDLRRLVATRAEQLNQLQKLKSEEAQIQLELDDLMKIYNKFDKMNFDQAAYQALRKEVLQFEPAYTQFKVSENEVKKLPEVVKEIESFTLRVNKGSNMLVELGSQITALNFSKPKYQDALQNQRQKEQLKDQALKLVTEYEQLIQKITAEIKEYKKEIAQQNKIIKSIDSNKKEFTELDELDGIFKNFKTHILEKVKPIISENASLLFQRITNGKYEAITVDDNFEFHIFDNAVKYPISRFSGGEIDLANLCLRIGISKAIAELTGSEEGLSFLGFDEIFGSQDDERRHQILLAFDLLKEQYRQIYIISHIDSVKEHFPNIIEVRKTSTGQSQIDWLSQ